MILEADGIQLNFGETKVLNNIYLRLQQGEVVGVLGLNGTGKSCLFQIIYGTMKAYCASVRLDGKPWIDPWNDPEQIRYLPQTHFIPASRRILEVLNDYQLTSEILISDFPMFSDRLHERVRDLSGGMQRVLEGFIILRSGASFILLDEPFSSISPVEIDQFKKLIQTTKTQSGILLSDHYYRHILEVSDRLYLLRNHRLIEVTDRDDLTEQGYLPVPMA